MIIESKKQLHGYDYDGVITNGLIPSPGSVIITGRKESDGQDIHNFAKAHGDLKVHFLPDSLHHTTGNISKHKSETIKKLGITKFFEDEDPIIRHLEMNNPDVEVIKVIPLSFVTFTKGWDGMPVAYHLQQEGASSYIGQVQNNAELGIEDKEDKEDKEQRLLQYNGMIKKVSAKNVFSALSKLKDKEDYFVFCDQNNLYPYGEILLKAGFTKGLFPTKQDFDMEKEREGAMDFVREHYPSIKIIPHYKVKTVEDAKKMIETMDVPLVIQSEGDYVPTICPGDDVTQNHTEILSALEKYKSDYAKGQIILKEKLIQPVEITPQIVFWNGKPVFTDIDIETKNIGDGENNGNQVGCGSNLIIKTDFNAKINKIAFPPIVYEMAAERKGMFIWDISMYVTEKGIFFGEFCSGRPGYDALPTEMAMSGGARSYFQSLVVGENPLRKNFGAAVRVFNLNRQTGQTITMGDTRNTWLYEVTQKQGNLVSVGDCWDLGVITGVGDTFSDAVDDVYKNLETLSFKEKYTRTKADFMSDYPTSILRRFLMTNHVLFDAPDDGIHKENESLFTKKLDFALADSRQQYENDKKDIESKHQQELKSLREEIKQILNED